MTIQLSPTDVPQRGPSGRAALGLFLIALVSLVSVAVIGKDGATAPSPPPPAIAPSAALAPTAGPTATPRRTSGPTPVPTPPPSCPAPRIATIAGPLPRHPRALVPTGLETVASWSVPDGRLVADRDGSLWSFGSGPLTRFDPATGISRRWTFGDDEAFAATGIVAARDGGIWLLGSRTLAWFDGMRFRDVIDVPGQVADLAEAPDGSIWAGTWDHGLYHWDGRAWTSVCANPRGTGIDQVAIGPADEVWVANTTSDGGRAGFSRLADGRWTFVAADAAVPFTSSWVIETAVDPTGNLMVAFDRGVARYTGVRWESFGQEGIDLTGTVSASFEPDGTIWLAAGTSQTPVTGFWGPPIGVGVARFLNGWKAFGPDDGLPAPTASSWSTIAAVAATDTGVYATTRDGLYRLWGDRWERVGSRPPSGPTSAAQLLAVSGDEVLATTWDEGLWRLHDGRFTRLPVASWPRSAQVHAVALARDGTLAVATSLGLAVRRGGRWEVLDKVGDFPGVALDEGGAVWTCFQSSDGVLTIGRLRLQAGRWVRSVLDGSPATWQPPAGCGQVFVVDRTGGVWIGTGGWVSDLVHHGRDGWERVRPLGESTGVGTASIALAPNGDVWAALLVMGPTPAVTVGRYDGSTWTVFGAGDGLPGTWASRLAVAPDGAVWVSTDAGLASFDGKSWTTRFAGQWFDAVSVAPDGTVWVVGPSGIHRLAH